MIHCYLPEKDKQELFLALIEVLFAEKEMLATDSDGDRPFCQIPWLDGR